MRFFKNKTEFDFMARRRLAMIFSMVLIVISLASLMTRGLNFGIDFTGGTLVEVGFTQAPDISKVRHALDEAGFGDAVTQTFGTSRDILIRLLSGEGLSRAEVSTQIIDALRSADMGEVTLRRVEFVGPKVGGELKEDGGLAMLVALLGILIYVAFRFEKRFALGSVAALVHDVIITLGFFSLFQLDFDLTILAAILAVIGYSLNDTIVVYDRIRENFRKLRKRSPLEVVNISLNQTLARTLMTSVTTLLVLVALFVLGGEIIHGFSLALIVGIFIGTYSSIYVASTTVLAMGVSKADLMPVEQEGADMADLDSRP